jgi:hypothetical protein
MLPPRFDGGIGWRPTDLINEALDSLLPPDSDSFLQDMQLSLAVPAGISNLELGEQLKCGLIGIFFQALDHFCPLVREDATLSPAPFVVEHPVSLCADRHTALASIFTPAVHAPKERWILSWREPFRELDREYIEELHRADVRHSLESAGDNRPRHPQGLDSSRARLGVDRLHPDVVG